MDRSPTRTLTAATSSGVDVFGSRTATLFGKSAMVARSHSCHCEPRGLTRICVDGRGVSSARSSYKFSRACRLRLGAMASSRSMATMSASEAKAFATRSGLSPGTYSKVSATLSDSVSMQALFLEYKGPDRRAISKDERDVAKACGQLQRHTC